MNCGLCATAQQLGLNLLLALDQFGNALLLGDPNETISRRTARAWIAGHRWAKILCQILNVISKNHCAWALEPGPSIGVEILHLSQPPLPRQIIK